jgi:small-conductance mechanosensitive channel
MLQIKSSALSNAMKENRMLKKEVDELKNCSKEATAIHEDNCILQQQLDEAKIELLKARKQIAVLSDQLEETNRLARNAIEKAQRKESERWVSFCGSFDFFLFFFSLFFLVHHHAILGHTLRPRLFQELRKQLDHAKEDLKELRSRLPRSDGLEIRCTPRSKWDVPCGHRIDIFPLFDGKVGVTYPNCETNWCQKRRAFERALKK